jgi:hypothetical protein
MANAANLGGDIRHPEISASASHPAASGGEPFARAVGAGVTDATWIWPAFETLHFIGLCLLFGIAALGDFRMLGIIRAVPFRGLHRLLPWGVLEFGVNLLTRRSVLRCRSWPVRSQSALSVEDHPHSARWSKPALLYDFR